MPSYRTNIREQNDNAAPAFANNKIQLDQQGIAAAAVTVGIGTAAPAGGGKTFGHYATYLPDVKMCQGSFVSGCAGYFLLSRAGKKTPGHEPR